jgi:Icc-related predicted phosphoesterase
MSATYLVYGDLHGRVLPAFAIARAWQRDHDEEVTALLQVGDLGYFPHADRLDRATKRHAKADPLELGVQQIVRASMEADELFEDPQTPGRLWFIAGNHEDYEALTERYGMPGSTDNDFPVDVYDRVRCVVSGHVCTLPGDLKVGGLWGIDGFAPKARRNVTATIRLDEKHAKRLAMQPMDVLLTHESPRDAVWVDAGSEAISLVIEQAQPSFSFFGHYHEEGRLSDCHFGQTQVFHMAGLEFRSRGKTAEFGSVGVLRLPERTFEYVELDWLQKLHRDNWRSF